MSDAPHHPSENTSDNAEERNKGGRPELPDSENRKTFVKVHLNQTEANHLDALRGSFSRARFIRERIINTPIPRGSNDPLIFLQLKRIGNNINQVAKVLNEGNKVTDEGLQNQYHELKELYDKITRK